MRISDWSSDVCSSDLVAVGIGQCLAAFGLEVQRPSRPETLEDIVRPRAGSDQFRLSRGFEIGAAKAERSLKAAILVENHAGRDQRGPRQMIGEPIGGAPIFAQVQTVRYPRLLRLRTSTAAKETSRCAAHPPSLLHTHPTQS